LIISPIISIDQQWLGCTATPLLPNVATFDPLRESIKLEPSSLEQESCMGRAGEGSRKEMGPRKVI
jgi:hypothetical protein